MTLLIYASTLFVKQHFFLDVISGIAVALASWGIIALIWRQLRKRAQAI